MVQNVGYRAALAALIALSLAGCGSSDQKSRREAAITPQGKQVKLKTGGVPEGQRTVKLVVVTTPSHETMALVPVRINGRGPYPFAVDTGASASLIDARLAQKLSLPDEGTTGLLSGVAGSAHGTKTRLSDWSIGRVRLPAVPIASLKLAGPDGKGPMGLLGSDVLSRFGKVAVDYEHSRLILDPRLKH
jgi:predicted aspartyl protease